MKTHDKRTETHACDSVSRAAAIEAVIAAILDCPNSLGVGTREYRYELIKELIEPCLLSLPAAQPDIIRCKDCKYAEVADPEDTQDGYTCQFHRGSIWFSGSYCSWAERRTDENNNE